jgi:hypothetical protein
LLATPIIVHPDFDREFILQTGVSDVAICAVLAQVNEQGEEHPIAYVSRTDIWFGTIPIVEASRENYGDELVERLAKAHDFSRQARLDAEIVMKEHHDKDKKEITFDGGQKLSCSPTGLNAAREIFKPGCHCTPWSNKFPSQCRDYVRGN